MPANKWLEWAKELQFLSQCALAYCSDPYDIERFQRIREISAEMVSEIGDLPLDLVKTTFCAGTGYQTPKLDTRRSCWYRKQAVNGLCRADGSIMTIRSAQMRQKRCWRKRVWSQNRSG